MRRNNPRFRLVYNYAWRGDCLFHRGAMLEGSRGFQAPDPRPSGAVAERRLPRCDRQIRVASHGKRRSATIRYGNWSGA